jgi:hypothetical protein
MIQPISVGMVFLMMVVNGCVTAKRCSDKFPESTNVVQTFYDTTIVTSSKTFDTIVSISNRDTIFIVDKNTDVRVKVVRLPGDSIFIQPECPADTIVVTKYRIETNVERVRNLMYKNGTEIFLMVFLCFLLLIGVSKIIDSIKR